MSTAKIRGMVNDDEYAVTVDAAAPAQYPMEQTAQRIEETAVQPIASASKVTPASNAIESPIGSAGQDTEQTIVLSNNPSEVVESTVTVNEIPVAETTGETRLAIDDDTVTRMMQPETTTDQSTIESPLQNEITAKRAAAEKLIRDMARADENIPYFFYLKSEPDIDIAIQHNDEKVIPVDFGRESISVNYRYLHFNLIDKPGKNGAICL